ncbi:hypothetical protein [Roseibium sp.]|uniref:hypothetical protein n=1 Tax=Roseibium sp. TaxID=1936156 RepID=UPI003B50C5F3
MDESKQNDMDAPALANVSQEHEDNPPVSNKRWHLPIWLTDKNVKIALIISGVVAIGISLPFGSVHWAFDQLYDQGMLYDPQKEGLIAVSSPQLFTRERLINQRLDESAWIDRRIAAVDEMIKEKRFVKPTDVRRVKEEFKFVFETKVAENEHADTRLPYEQINNFLEKDPLSEFKAANYYRQSLVQEKFQSILDDAHDTHSNTLQRLNFNLVISPARSHSTSVAAVSITLEQPKDPEWILHEYGELLNDVRDELQQTAKRMIADRTSIIRLDDYRLSAKTNDLLIAEIKKLSGDNEWRNDIEDLKGVILEKHKSTMIDTFRSYLQTVGNDPAIGSALLNIFFPPSQRLPQNRNSERGAGFGKILSTSLNSSVSAKPLGKQVASSPDDDFLTNGLNRSCKSGLISVWSLFPPHTTESDQYKALEDVFKDFYEADASKAQTSISPIDLQQANVSRGNALDTDFVWKLELRKLLSEKSFSAPCPPSPERVAQLALLELLGKLSLDVTIAEANAHVQGWERYCAAENKKIVNTFKGPSFAHAIRKGSSHQIFQELHEHFDGPSDYWNRCGAYRQSLLKIGVAHLVHAELNNTPIDTAGRVRRLDDYFVIDKDDCDVNSCQLIVRTISEDFRHRRLRALENKSKSRVAQKQESNCLGSYVRAYLFWNLKNPELSKLVRKKIEQCALMIGRQEALRLFAELSCFATARSYTIYPREGVGESVLEHDNRGWSLASIVGQGMTAATRESERARITHSIPILGIGDTGDPDQARATECGAPFLDVLNSFDVRDVLTESLALLLKNDENLSNYNKSLGINLDPKWGQRIRCLLYAAKNGALGPENEDFENCPDSQANALGDFDLHELTMVVRHLRQRKTTISWLIYPKDEGFLTSRHVAQSVPLSAIVSLPSWWPGVRIVTETCWLRPKLMRAESGRSLCPAKRSTVVPEKQLESGRRDASQVLPLPYNVEDVLPKLGFFLIRYPYIDSFEPSDITLESGREVKLRLTGKRLWKNPMVRIGEQWQTKVEVLPDMRGVVATFKCLAPLSQTAKKKMVNGNIDTILIASSREKLHRNDPYKKSVADTPALVEKQDADYTETRPVQVWTSEGNTSQVTVTVRAFRPNYRLDGMIEAPCWASDQMAEIRKKNGEKQN